MSAFTNGFKHGFMHGMFNNMFGGGWCNPFMNSYGMGFNPFRGYCNPFNNFGFGCNPYMSWNPASMFMTPSYSFNNFTLYQSPSLPMPSVWNVSVPNFSVAPAWSNLNYAMQDFTIPSFTSSNSSGDTFTSTNISREKQQKLENNDEIKKVSKSDVKISYNAQELKTKWNNSYKNTKHLTNDFFEKVVTISKELECDPNDLMAVINLETAGSFRASVQNKKSRATGLIQFMPETAKDMNTSIDALKNMSEVEQLDYVKKYLQDRKKAKGIEGQIDATTLYCFVFWPAAANKNDSYEIANNKDKNVKTYNWNKGLDYNKDKSLTRGDLAQRVKEFMV